MAVASVETDGKETVTLGGGCFWCLQPLLQDLKGVEKVVVGYAGGHVKNPSYEQVCTDTTGHAEVVDFTFDPKVLPLEDALRVFFTVHDPTTLNRQGNDVGTQYRSAIFYHSPEQKAAAEATIASFNTGKIWSRPVVTELTPASTFFVAEDYHQEYFARTGSANPYCSMVVAPKVAKFRKAFLSKLKR